MTVSYQGSLSLGQVVPMALTAQATLDASLNAVLPDLKARIAGLLELSVRPPPALADLIAAARDTIAALQALVADPLPDVSAIAQALADLQASLGQIEAGLAFSLQLGGMLSTPGIYYYAYAGQAGALGGELSATLSAGLPGGGGPNEQVAGVILLARDGGAISALQSFFG